MANAQLNVKYIINRKVDNNLTFDEYIYRVNRRREDKMFWRCVERSCQAFLSTFNDIPTEFGRQIHNHPADHSNVVAKQIMSKISRRCLEEIRRIPTIFTEEPTKPNSETTNGMAPAACLLKIYLLSTPQ